MATQDAVQLDQVNQRLVVTQSCLSDSTFKDVNLANATFDDINFSGAKIQNANLSGWQVKDVSFSGLQLSQSDLRGASIVDCLMDGMTIDGVAVVDLMAAYRSLTSKNDVE